MGQSSDESEAKRKILFALSVHELNRKDAQDIKQIREQFTRAMTKGQRPVDKLAKDKPKRPIRQLLNWLRIKLPQERVSFKIKCNALLYKMIYQQETKSRDLILRIGTKCGMSLADVFITQEDVRSLLQ